MKTAVVDESGLAELRDRIRRRAGLNFPESRMPDLEAGIRRAMTSTGTGDIRDFTQRLETEAAVFDTLIANSFLGESAQAWSAPYASPGRAKPSARQQN